MLVTNPIGTIEGFFGRAWSHQARKDHIDFLADQGASFYIYAPKSDPYLRKNWQSNWPDSEFKKLQELRQHCALKKIAFGIGLSPFGAPDISQPLLAELLTNRIEQINRLAPDLMGIFFDDMRGDTPNLAEIQVFCLHLVEQLTPAKLIFCPTYYSFDPVLERVFGTMPSGYFESIRSQLNPSIDIFWTGEKVCSRHYSIEHINQVSQLLGRKPFIWDNYPVNDGAVKSQHLHLSPVDSSLSNVAPLIAGRAINPMNQAYLSQCAMSSSIAAHHNRAPKSPLRLSQALNDQLQVDLPLFEQQGLGAISASENQLKQSIYRQYFPNPFAEEVLAWLNGEYVFDPACLTD